MVLSWWFQVGDCLTTAVCKTFWECAWQPPRPMCSSTDEGERSLNCLSAYRETTLPGSRPSCRRSFSRTRRTCSTRSCLCTATGTTTAASSSLPHRRYRPMKMISQIDAACWCTVTFICAKTGHVQAARCACNALCNSKGAFLCCFRFCVFCCERLSWGRYEEECRSSVSPIMTFNSWASIHSLTLGNLLYKTLSVQCLLLSFSIF